MADPICDRCAGAMVYSGRISLPPQIIYKCESCGNQQWTADTRPSYQARPTAPADQPQAQQQQQPQPKRDDDT